MENSARSLHSYTVIRRTWLSRRLNAGALPLTVATTLSLVLASLMYWSDSWGATHWMSASGEQVYSLHQYWRAWTTLWVHADFRHLFSNALLFFILGIFLSGYFGPLVFPLLALAAGGAINFFVLLTMPQQVVLMGASGVVLWMGGFWLTLYFFLDRGRTPRQRGLRAFGVALALFAPTEAFDPSISYASHGLGFVFGVLCGGLYYGLYRQQFLNSEDHETIYETTGETPDDPISVGLD